MTSRPSPEYLSDAVSSPSHSSRRTCCPCNPRHSRRRPCFLCSDVVLGRGCIGVLCWRQSYSSFVRSWVSSDVAHSSPGRREISLRRDRCAAAADSPLIAFLVRSFLSHRIRGVLRVRLSRLEGSLELLMRRVELPFMAPSRQ
jgi:hypothetical protein